MKNILWCALLSLSLVACGGDDEEDDPTPDNAPVAPVEPIAPTAVPVDPTAIAPSPDDPNVPPVEPVAVGDPTPSPSPTTGPSPSPSPSPASDPDDDDPDDDSPPNMAEVQRCMVRGDNACVQRALRGHTQNAQQERMLIEATRAMGRSGEAQRLMRDFVQQHPEAPQSDVYRQMLERGSSGGTPLPNPADLLGGGGL